MAKYSYVHGMKFKGSSLPDALLDAIFAKGYTSCAGVAIPGAIDEYLGTFLQSEATNTAAVQELLAGHVDREVVLSFGKIDGDFHEDDVQPHVALTDDTTEGNTTMAIFMSGPDFASKAKGKDQSAELQVFTKLILPQILKASKNLDDDADQTFKDMASDPAVAGLMEMFHGDDSIITMVTNAGCVSWGDTTKHAYDFGWFSDPCGFELKAAEPANTATSKKNPLSLKSAKAPPEGLKPAEATASSARSLSEASSSDVSGAKDEADVDLVAACPPSGWTKDQKRRWYLEHNIYIDGKVLTAGIVPEGYKNCPKVMVAKSKIEGTDKPTTVKAFSEIDKDKVVTSSNTGVTNEVLPLIAPNDKRFIIENIMKRGHVQKTMSAGKTIIDPKRIAELENDWPAFIEAGGMEDIRCTFSFLTPEIDDIVRKAPSSAVVLIQDLQIALYNTLKKHGELDLKVAASEKEQTDVHIAASQTLRPAKKGLSLKAAK